MVSLVRAASCLFIPFTVAAVGGGALAEDASNLIQAHVALAPTANGTGDSQVLHSLLVTAWADLAAQAAQVQLASAASAARTVALSANQLRMHEAARYLQDAVAKDNAVRRRADNSTCRAMCVINIATDAAWIAMETYLQFKGDTDKLCSIGALVYWWTTGILTLTVDQGLTLPEALHMLTQQVSTIGYGTDTPPENSTGLKLFHGLHAVLSQMSVGRMTADIMNQLLKALPGGDTPQTRTAVLLLTTAASAFLFAADLKVSDSSYANYGTALADALYLAMMTMTTVGYGDLAPSTPMGQFLSPLGLPLLTNAFADFQGGLGPKTGPSDPDAGDETPSELCMCMGNNWCEMAKSKMHSLQETVEPPDVEGTH